MEGTPPTPAPTTAEKLPQPTTVLTPQEPPLGVGKGESTESQAIFSHDKVTRGKGNVGVLTSGGDAQGMNAAVRAVVRTAVQRGVKVFAICEGYKGLIDNQLKEMNWSSVSGVLEKGGTALGTARCLEFMQWEGLKKGALTLIQHGIYNLVVIGGDGSLTGANRLRTEWSKLVDELLAEKLIEKTDTLRPLSILGLVGSIDNDMFGTDMTIGADSALHRIVSAIDAIGSTAASHKRSFVIEVMGRNCGWLALTAALATGADFVFFPEDPPEKDAWQKQLCDQLEKAKDLGRRMSTVVIAEGAIDSDGNPIISDAVKKLIETTLGLDTRVTILGHVQRGGRPSAYDRIMSTRLGETAVNTLLATEGPRSDLLVGVRGASVTLNPLMDCVSKTKAVATLIKEKKFCEAQALRGHQFLEAKEVFYTTSSASVRPPTPRERKVHTIAIMHAGAGAPGMNNAVRTAVRSAVDKGHNVMGVYMGFNGLLQGDLRELTWTTVSGWSSMGGALLGTGRKIPKTKEDSRKIAEILEQFHITALIIIGGWEAVEGSLQLEKHKNLFPALGLPKILIPASISNNIPGTEFSIGSDTALNSIIDAVDKIRQSAESYGRVIIIEVMGSRCGYLAFMSALATGAETVYLPEEGISLERLKNDCAALVNRFKGRTSAGGVGLVILNENASAVYDIEFLKSVFTEEGAGHFSVRHAVLGHLQQGGEPSPGDRIRATKMASYAIKYIDRLPATEGQSILLGEVGGETKSTCLEDISGLSDLANRRPKDQWWLPMRYLLDELSIPRQPGGS